MPYRRFGRTGLQVSAVGFGSWPIGGQAYGAVSRDESLRALARAEELGCNFVDTAMVYGDAEPLLGEFLAGRRERWIVATKYSGQPEGLTATLEAQLRRLRTDRIDYYQLHWAARADEQSLYEALYQARRSGKVRFVGVSLKNAADIDYVIDHTQIDGVQFAVSLLDPEPLSARLSVLRRSGLAVIARSALREGFLTGKYARDARFSDPLDQRSSWSAQRIAATVDQVERFRFLEAEQGSMLLAAARYPLSFDVVSTVILGTRSAAYADSNFGLVPAAGLAPGTLAHIAGVQRELGLFDTAASRWRRRLSRLFGR
jgi:aryl-alcohol dehydrogenase-like predicted oxidoreductase